MAPINYEFISRTVRHCESTREFTLAPSRARNFTLVQQEAQLSQRGRAMPRVVEYFD